MRSGTYESSDGTKVGTAVTFLLIGLGIGALTALAFAPKTGRELRKDLKRGYNDAKDTIEDWTEEAGDRLQEAGEKVRDAVERGAELADQIRGKVEPLRKIINRG